MKKLIIICVLLLITVFFANAQQNGKNSAPFQMPTPQECVKQLDQKVKLTDEQKTKATVIYTDLGIEFNKMIGPLSDTTGDKNVRYAMIMASISRIKQLSADGNNRLRAILDKDQVKKFNVWLEESTATQSKSVGETANIPAIGVGVASPEFALADTAGKTVTLSSFKGKYVLVDFWASWCVPCRAENPNVVKAYNKYKTKNFTILGVSLDRAGDKDKWLAAIHKDGLTWTQVSDLKGWNSDIVKTYHIFGIPQNFLIDPNGKIIAESLRGQALEDKLEEIFGKM